MYKSNVRISIRTYVQSPLKTLPASAMPRPSSETGKVKKFSGKQFAFGGI